MASAVAHQTVCWPQVYKRKPRIYCVVCGQYTKPSRQGKKLYKCVEQECKNRIHAECNAGYSSFNCTLTNLALLRKQEGSVNEKITLELDDADLPLKKINSIEHIEITNCERLKLQENNECDIPLEKSEEIIHRNIREEADKKGLKTDINNNRFYDESHQHRKEHKRKSILINDKTDEDILLVESHESNKKAKQASKDSDNLLVESHESSMKSIQDSKDSDINPIQHRKEHKRKSSSGLENIAYPIIHTEKNESFEINVTKNLELEEFYGKAKNIYDIFIKQLHFEQQYGYIGEFCEDTDIEISEADYDEPYLELLEQLYFKGHVTDRNRKKYMRKWRKHKKKRKRICKKVKHFPTVSPKMEENEEDQDKENVFVGSSVNNMHDEPSVARYADMYNELYDEYKNSSNKPPEDENFMYLVRENNGRNLQPFELPQLTYIIDNTDPDEYQPPDHYFD